MTSLKNIRKKLVSLAVASAVGGGVLLASAPAQAVNVSQNNVGEVLLFPFYTVENGFDTIFTVTNTSDRTVVIKVRWREALNSREVRDFNVVLSPQDVWTAGVTIDGTEGALVRTFDKTCTSPALPASVTMAGATEVAFTSIGYDGSDAGFPTDNGGTTLTRVQEGYFEVFNMGEFAAGQEDNAANIVAFGAKHVAGVPRDCGDVAGSVAADYATLLEPTNVLKGAVSYINVTNGTAVDATPTSIESWASAPVWFAPGDLNPTLANGDALMTANWINNGVPESMVAAAAEDAVSVLLMADSVVNEFSASGTATQTDWVLTFPTKHHYTDGLAAFPFGDDFVTGGKSCNTYGITLWNREEGTVIPSGNSFSPAPTGSSASLCYEVNVLSFNGAGVLGTGINHQSVSTAAVGSSGWARLTMAGYQDTVGLTPGVGGPVGLQGSGALPLVSGFSGDAGLPVIGFASVVRNNAAVAGDNRNYGSSVQHAYERN